MIKPTDQELKTFACEWWRKFGFVKDKATCTWSLDEVSPEHFVDFSRTVLTRWGNLKGGLASSAPAPAGEVIQAYQAGRRDAEADAWQAAEAAEGEPSDYQIMELMPEEMHADLAAAARAMAEQTGTDSIRVKGLHRIMLNRHVVDLARAVLARWRSPNLAELRKSLGEPAERQVAPVPVASDVHFEFVVSDADYCTQAGGIAPTYAQALSEGQNYLAQYQQDGPHTLEVRRVEVLPLPGGEVEP